MAVNNDPVREANKQLFNVGRDVEVLLLSGKASIGHCVFAIRLFLFLLQKQQLTPLCCPLSLSAGKGCYEWGVRTTRNNHIASRAASSVSVSPSPVCCVLCEQVSVDT